ncbi:MAG: NAD(P)/FAD-dependent oxidoreductase [Thermomicrobiales bacterium]
MSALPSATTVLPTQADAVVIGAGAFGFSVAYQLVRLGAGSVVLLDQFEPGTQVSPRAAGLFKMIQASETKTRLALLSRQIVTGFEHETGIPIPHKPVGSLFIARTPAHAGMVAAEVEDATGWGVAIERIDATEAERLCGYLDAREIVSVHHIEDDLYIEEPRSMLIVYWQAGAALGLQVHGHTPVTGIVVQGNVVSGVETAVGRISTPLVVDAAGVWARTVGQMAGVDIPILPMRHQLRITSPIDGITANMPIVRITDASAYARPARGGLMFGGFESDPVPYPVHLPAGFTTDMIGYDPELSERFATSLLPSIPALTNHTSQEDRGGLSSMTADGRLIAGPVPSLRGFWVTTGCNGSGFSLSSAVGRCIAEWIVAGEPPFDLSLLDPARFDRAGMTAEVLLQEATRQYANYYTPSA